MSGQTGKEGSAQDYRTSGCTPEKQPTLNRQDAAVQHSGQEVPPTDLMRET